MLKPTTIKKKIRKAIKENRMIIFQQVDGSNQPCGAICEPFVSNKAISFFNDLSYRNIEVTSSITGTLIIKFRW